MAASLALVAGSIVLPPPLAVARVFDPISVTLDNGFQVVAITNHRAPVVSVLVLYKVGGADDPPGLSGLAHYLEHLMFKGTATTAAGEFNRRIARHGGRTNAFTTRDFTAYTTTIASAQLEMVLRLEADRLANLQPSEAVPELGVIQQERRQTVENTAASRLRESVNATAFVRHPYGTPVIGWPEEIQALTLDDAMAFRRRWYVPGNAVLIVAGDINVDRLMALAKEIFGPLPVAPQPVRRRLAEPDLPTARRVTLRDAEVRQPVFERFWPVPTAPAVSNQDPTTPDDGDALDVLATILDDTTGPLYRRLVVEQRQALSVGVRYLSGQLERTQLAVRASPAPSISIEQLEAAIGEELTKLVSEGVTNGQVERAKTQLATTAIIARDSLSGPVFTVASGLATGHSLSEIEAWPARIAAVTPEMIARVAARVFTQANHITGLLLPTDPVTTPDAK